MTNNSPGRVNFKFSTYNDYETEYSEAFKKAAKEVNLNMSEKLAIALRPLFRKKSALMHLSTGAFVTTLFFLYCLVCALTFKSFEGDHYLKTMSIYNERKLEMRNTFWQFRDEKYPWPWTFGHSFAFVIWVYSTIGDGKMYPVTPMGRIFCMVSALVGIPFFVLVITYHGRAINEFFKLIYNYRNFLYRHPSAATTSQFEEDEQTTAKPEIAQGPPTYTLKFDENGTRDSEREESHLGAQLADSSVSAPSTSSLKVITFINRQDLKVPSEKAVVHFPYSEGGYRLPDHINVLPASATFVILCLYILMGALLIENRLENLNFLTSFYYLFITMSTIGFGDVDPWINLNFAHYLYIVIGVAMFAMVFESIKVTFRRNFITGMQKVLQHLKVVPLMENIIIVPNEMPVEEMDERQEESEKRETSS